jgi:hypothetical protein
VTATNIANPDNDFVARFFMHFSRAQQNRRVETKTAAPDKKKGRRFRLSLQPA